MKELIEARRARSRKPRKDKYTTGDHINKKMDDDVYKLRRKVIDEIYNAKALLKERLGIDMPRVNIRVTDLAYPESRTMATARLGKNVVWVTEDTITAYKKYLHEVVYHELVHAVFGFGHYNSCPLMGPTIGSKPMSPAKVDKAFLKYAKMAQDKGLI